VLDGVEFARYILNVLKAREKDISDALAHGAVQDWEQYKSLVGEIRGVAFAREEIKALLEKNADDVEDLISS
tara:strand:+ start:218 stop:433 length:216 start_codon:yes stop_codon:yes gene_type:complete